MIRSFQELDAWKKSVVLAVDVYRATANYPAEERFGLTSQSRRAAVSVGANIAEGFGRHSTRDFLRYLEIAQGSLEELRHRLIVGRELNFLPRDDFNRLNEECDEAGRLIGGLRRALQKRLR